EFDYIHIEDDDNNNIRNSLADKGVKTDTGSLISLRSSESGSQKSQGVNKRKKQSFTKQYFEKGFNIKGEETRICTILSKDGNRCGQMYRNTGSSTGNLIAHLRDIHQIIDEDNHDGENNYKRLRNTKITDYARSHHPHPKHIQKQQEESLLRWMLLTDQPISTVTNPAYKEKMSQFDPSFV
ncbi:13048_t:CDS:2, partial [Rhizophagus irregularis]